VKRTASANGRFRWIKTVVFVKVTGKRKEGRYGACYNSSCSEWQRWLSIENKYVEGRGRESGEVKVKVMVMVFVTEVEDSKTSVMSPGSSKSLD
jgi:hypothetical protein